MILLIRQQGNKQLAVAPVAGTGKNFRQALASRPAYVVFMEGEKGAAGKESP